MKPQTRQTLMLLRERPQGVTALDALAAIGSWRFAARVEELRKLGYPVTSETVRTGSGKSIARYRLIEGPEQMVVGL